MSTVPQVHWARTPDGLYIAYQDLGSGPALVLVNGMYSHIEVYWEWPQFARFVRRLSTSLRVLHFDRRGTGMSDRVTDDPTLERSLDDVNAVLAAAGVDRAAIYGWYESAPLAAMFAATYPEKTLAVLLDGDLRQKWAPDYPWGTRPEEEELYVNRLYEIWGQDEHALEIGQLTCGDRPEDGPWHDEDFVRVHAKLARFATTPGGFLAFTRTEYETDAREVARTIHVPAAVLVKERAAPSWLGVGAALSRPPEGSPVDAASADLSSHGVAAYNASLIPGARLVTVPGAAVIPFFDQEEAYADAMIAFVRSVQHEEAILDRMLATVLFTDIVGSTDKACELGDRRWTELLERHHHVVRAMLARYRGTEVGTTGDGFLATFDGPARAVKCAQAICEAVRPLGLEVRAGCHTGEIELMGSDVGGIAVHIGARVAALAGPSEVLVSSTVKDLVAGSGLVFDDRGEHELKGVPEKWRLYAARLEERL
jgi:class 3 adenylate cyclase/pimeloyl-ACP methyl ester carboxylesterase